MSGRTAGEAAGGGVAGPNRADGGEVEDATAVGSTPGSRQRSTESRTPSPSGSGRGAGTGQRCEEQEGSEAEALAAHQGRVSSVRRPPGKSIGIDGRRRGRDFPNPRNLGEKAEVSGSEGSMARDGRCTFRRRTARGRVHVRASAPRLSVRGRSTAARRRSGSPGAGVRSPRSRGRGRAAASRVSAHGSSIAAVGRDALARQLPAFRARKFDRRRRRGVPPRSSRGRKARSPSWTARGRAAVACSTCAESSISAAKKHATAQQNSALCCTSSARLERLRRGSEPRSVVQLRGLSAARWAASRRFQVGRFAVA